VYPAHRFKQYSQREARAKEIVLFSYAQQPYDALVKRLEAYQTSGKAPTREMELVTAQQTISKKSAWKVGFKNLVHALNSGTN
jgi:hypothetical protein